MRTEAEQILADVIGSDAAVGRYVYVLPAFGGYDIIMHESPDKRRLTDKEQDEFRERIRERMHDLAIQHAPPQTAKTNGGPIPE